MRFVCAHGWSFDHTLWLRIQDQLPEARFELLDFGYRAEKNIEFDAERPFVAVGHSAGFAWLIEQRYENCQGYISINGFSRFTRADNFPGGVSQVALKRMLRGLQSEEGRVVADFQQRCGLQPSGEAAQPENRDALVLALEWLMHVDVRQQVERLGDRVATLCTTDDPIVSVAMSEDSFQSANREWTQGGHLLPLSRASQCASFLMAQATRFGAS